MARYKPVHKGLKLLPVDFDQQILPGSFEFALCHLVDHEMDLSAFHARYKNDEQGASAFDPAVLIKIILLAYSRGIISSRKIETACRENVTFMAVSGDSQPHFTTLAAFVATMGDLVTTLFAQILTVCERQGLIGHHMFAIDGVKLPSNASKAKSGTRQDYQRQLDKMEASARHMIERHQAQDHQPQDAELARKDAEKLARLQQEAQQLQQWLQDHPDDRKGRKNRVILSNRTDNESAKMATGKGVIQGYTGVACVDDKHQIIVSAEAHGTGSEHELLLPAIEATGALLHADTIITADAGYHSEANLNALAEKAIDAFIPDNGYRLRDPRYANQSVHTQKADPLWDKRRTEPKIVLFSAADFSLAPDHRSCVCPAGKTLRRNGSNATINGYAALLFKGVVSECGGCDRRAECLRHPEKTRVRQVAFLQGKRPGAASHSDKMKAKIDAELGRRMITQRFATVEPVFGNLRANKQLTRFTLRSKKKVDGQWKLYCMMHNIEKLAHHGYAA